MPGRLILYEIRYPMQGERTARERVRGSSAFAARERFLR
jgi:hypothetical protein